jgi:predicted enzyme related to lactoylglutathione lyase
MKITEIAFTGYPITDAKRSRAFYEGVLGLEASRTFGEGELLWIEYDLGAATFALSNMSAEEWRPSNDGPVIAFEVDDFDGAIERLKANEVDFVLEPFASPVCRMTIIRDPDGNALAIHKRNPQ